MTHDDAFLADIRQSPADPGPKLIYADWLEEHCGNALAHAYRWAAHRRRHPYVSPKGRITYWQRATRGARGAFNLPGPVYTLLAAGKGRRKGPAIRVYRDDRTAFAALAVALEALRKLYEVQP